MRPAMLTVLCIPRCLAIVARSSQVLFISFIHIRVVAMAKCALISLNVAVILVALLPVVPAQAANTTSFVSSTGSGTACTRAIPCGDFGVAAAATATGGEIGCLDTGPIQGGSLTKSVTIDCAS